MREESYSRDNSLDKARELSETYPVLTRITTRISAEEMVEDPMFEVADVPVPPTRVYRLTAQSRDLSLQGCEARIQDTDEYDEIVASQVCSATYCDWVNASSRTPALGVLVKTASSRAPLPTGMAWRR